MSKHTPEPWTVNNGENAVRLPGRNGNKLWTWIASIIKNPADAHRIVACVNACAGINPEAVPLLLEELRELCALVEGTWSAAIDPLGKASARARAAIEKATATP